MQGLKKVLQEWIQMTTQEWLDFEKILDKKEYKAKTILIREGVIARHIYFIETGLLRAYHLQKGQEINTYFAADQQFISTFSSFISQSPSFEFLETIEPSVVYRISYRDLSALYSTSPKFSILGKILAEQNYLCLLDRTLMLQTKTAKQKYLNFIEKNPIKISTGVPQRHIASFLGIAPESLSRIRKEIATS